MSTIGSSLREHIWPLGQTGYIILIIIIIILLDGRPVRQEIPKLCLIRVIININMLMHAGQTE